MIDQFKCKVVLPMYLMFRVDGSQDQLSPPASAVVLRALRLI